MHQHWSVPQWIRALGESEEQPEPEAAWCARARELWREDLHAWAAHVRQCARCREVAVALTLVPDEVLDCPECRDSLEVVHHMVDELEHFDPLVALELPRAEAMLEEVRHLSLEGQIEKVIEDLPYRQWGFCQRLLFEAKRSWTNNPRLAHDRAVLAVAVAERLLPADYDPQWIADLQAKAHAYLANVLRILAQFRTAEEELRVAEDRLAQGVGSGREEARVLGLRASLLMDQNRYHEALALLDRVEKISKERKDRHEVGRISLKRARVVSALGRASEAAEECVRAAAALNGAREASLLILAQQNAVYYLVQAGETQRARQLFDSLAPVQDRMMQICRLWIEADLLRAEGRHDEARQTYERTREEFAADKLHYDAALVTLDLALTAFQQGDTVAVKRMAEEASILVTRAEAKQEAFAALSLLLRAVEAETVTVATLQQVRRRLAKVKPS